jgi:hypothetical protein
MRLMDTIAARAVLSSLLLLTAAFAPAGPAALAIPAAQAAGGAGVHFQGTFDLGSSPGPVGTLITVIVARSVDDVTTCGTGSVTGANGQFRVDTQPSPPCLNSATSRNNGPFMFIANGENVGGCACMPTLESPTSLGHTMRVDLRGTPISALAAGSASGEFMPVPAVRLWGSLTLANNPAPTGTAITARTVRIQAACGQGMVIDDSGTYWLDVPANASCATSRLDGSPGPYVLTVNGENVGGCACLPSLDAPASLGHTMRVDLRGYLEPARVGDADGAAADNSAE